MAAVENLWAPWRLEYVTGDKPVGCVLCAKQETGGDDRAAHVVARGEHCYAVLNLYPYNNGHLMVVPYRHVAELDELTADAAERLMRESDWLSPDLRRYLPCAVRASRRPDHNWRSNWA